MDWVPKYDCVYDCRYRHRRWLTFPRLRALAKRPRRPQVYIALFILRCFNGGLIPTFMTIRDFQLYDTFLVMVRVFGSAFNIIVARTFSRAIPEDLWEAAQLDGRGNLRYFVTIVIPLSKAVISVIALWTAVGHWNPISMP